jgi:prevent-host-death family protein
MAMKERTVGAAEFKANCLKIMAEVERTREPVLVTKRGRPLVRLVPAVEERPKLRGALEGWMTIRGDIVAPLEDEWEANR